MPVLFFLVGTFFFILTDNKKSYSTNTKQNRSNRNGGGTDRDASEVAAGIEVRSAQTPVEPLPIPRGGLAGVRGGGAPVPVVVVPAVTGGAALNAAPVAAVDVEISNTGASNTSVTSNNGTSATGAPRHPASDQCPMHATGGQRRGLGAAQTASKPPQARTKVDAVGHRVAHVAPPTMPLSHGGEPIKTAPFRARNSP